MDALYFGQVSVTTTLTGKTAEPITKVRYTIHYFYHNVLIHISHRILLFLLQLYLLRPGLSTEQMVGITNLTLRYVIIIHLLLTVHLQTILNQSLLKFLFQRLHMKKVVQVRSEHIMCSEKVGYTNACVRQTSA